ncbi:hypothetical protein EP837_01728 [Sphingobium sp. EP60837]|nr:hypothetical protein EP837_01728 [Sphingobium sp. EP60837]
MRWWRMAESLSPVTSGDLIAFDETGIKQVVADPLRFKKHLQIGEDAFALLKAKKQLSTVWETAGAAATGAGIASSSVVAGTFFAPTGLAAWLGLATAATPVGWVVAAAVVAGGGYYGVSRWLSGKTDKFVDTIPKYINSPIDVLGAALVDLLGSLALRVSAIDGRIDPAERTCILEHFVHDWGFDHTYVSRRLDALVPRSDETRVKALARDLSKFQASNPDCNAPAMQAELMRFLRELVAADGVIDEREELALEAIERILQEESRITAAKVGEGLAEASRTAGEAASLLGSAAKSVGGMLTRKVMEASRGVRTSTKS